MKENVQQLIRAEMQIMNNNTTYVGKGREYYQFPKGSLLETEWKRMERGEKMKNVDMSRYRTQEEDKDGLMKSQRIFEYQSMKLRNVQDMVDRNTEENKSKNVDLMHVCSMLEKELSDIQSATSLINMERKRDQLLNADKLRNMERKKEELMKDIRNIEVSKNERIYVFIIV